MGSYLAANAVRATGYTFAARPIHAKTVQYCVNDVIHLPDLHALYLRRIEGDWLARAMEESALRVAEAHSPGYEPQSPTKKLGPWGSGTEKRVMTLDKTLEDLETLMKLLLCTRARLHLSK